MLIAPVGTAVLWSDFPLKEVSSAAINTPGVMGMAKDTRVITVDGDAGRGYLDLVER